jgi:hypothetical protein
MKKGRTLQPKKWSMRTNRTPPSPKRKAAANGLGVFSDNVALKAPCYEDSLAVLTHVTRIGQGKADDV